MMKTIVSLLLVITMVAASGLRGPQDDDAIFCHLFVATGSEQKNTATKTSSTSACLTTKSRRRHEIDLPEAF
jgi:hypothetical protein